MIDQLVMFVQEQLQENELFKGGLLLVVGGSILALLRPWPRKVWGHIQHHSTVVIDIPDKDQAFKWMNIWLSEHNYSKNRARVLTVASERQDRTDDKPKIIFSPAPGVHYLWYKRRLMILDRHREDQAQSGVGLQNPFREYFTITLLGRNRQLALDLIEEAYELANPTTIDKIAVHVADGYGNWNLRGWVPKRHLDSIILPEGMKEGLIDDMNTFMDNEQWYADMGIPYQRGYLLYGSPGNGKTSIVSALAAHFKMDIGILNLNSPRLTDDNLFDSLASVPDNTIIVLEDIDCVVEGREVDGEFLSFSGLLNALDGIGSAHGQMVFMTTNYRSRLDDALIRPGRCDVQREFQNANHVQRSQMFDRFFPGTDTSVAFADIAGGDISMARLQQYLMECDNAQEALQNAPEIEKGSVNESPTDKT